MQFFNWEHSSTLIVIIKINKSTTIVKENHKIMLTRVIQDNPPLAYLYTADTAQENEQQVMF